MNHLTHPLAALTIGDERLTLTPSDMTSVGGDVYTATVAGIRLDLTVTAPTPDSFTTMLRLTNVNAENSPRVTGVRSFDVRFPATDALFDGLTGDSNGPDSYVPYTHELTETPHVLEPWGGRSSNTTAFPFFDIDVAPDKTYVFGIGWTGQWHAEIDKQSDSFGVSVGLADCDFYLLPGESVRFPLVLCMEGGDPVSAHVAFRRLMRDHFSPQKDMEEELTLPIAIAPFGRYFDRYFGLNRNTFWDTEAGQIATCDAIEDIPSMDTVWMDAAWFSGGAWWEGVGNYTYAEGFPNGMRPVIDYVHGKGKRFIQWFETERVLPGNEMAVWHPEFMLKNPNWDEAYVYNLADPAAAAYMTDLLTEFLIHEDIDVFRNDCNIDPLEFWRAADAPDRRGITEMHYVENLYTMWDTLRERIPGLLIDSCASGGRRLDVEMMSRSVSLWRSDTGCSFDREGFTPSVWNTLQIIALYRYVPFSMVGHWRCTTYDVRSTGTSGVACNYDILNPEFDKAHAETILSEAARIRPLWNGDFYPLCTPDLRSDTWGAYQLHRDGRGAVYAFRKQDAEDETFTVTLYAVDPAATYRVTLTDEYMRSVTETLRGDQLKTYTFRSGEKRESFLLEYEPADRQAD